MKVTLGFTAICLVIAFGNAAFAKTVKVVIDGHTIELDPEKTQSKVVAGKALACVSVTVTCSGGRQVSACCPTTSYTAYCNTNPPKIVCE
jgi:hypothetical protein